MVPVKAVVYSRVSTDAQERDGTSLDTQEKTCVEYAQGKGWVVAESIEGPARLPVIRVPDDRVLAQLEKRGGTHGRPHG
jgi:hypothetical protein